MSLLKAGHEIETVYVKTWDHEDDLLGECPGARDLKDAQAVADKLEIPFRILNLMDFYHHHVVDPMIQRLCSRHHSQSRCFMQPGDEIRCVA